MQVNAEISDLQQGLSHVNLLLKALVKNEDHDGDDAHNRIAYFARYAQDVLELARKEWRSSMVSFVSFKCTPFLASNIDISPPLGTLISEGVLQPLYFLWRKGKPNQTRGLVWHYIQVQYAVSRGGKRAETRHKTKITSPFPPRTRIASEYEIVPGSDGLC